MLIIFKKLLLIQCDDQTKSTWISGRQHTARIKENELPRVKFKQDPSGVTSQWFKPNVSEAKSVLFITGKDKRTI